MPREARIKRFVNFSILLSLAVGLLGIIGCFFHQPILRTIVPGFVAIAFNSSVCFLLLGASLCCLREREGGEVPRGMSLGGNIAAGIVVVVGVLSLVEFLGDLNFGIDQLFFTEYTEATLGHVRPGLMSPITAMNFVLLASALLLIDWTTRRRTWPSQVLCFIAGIVGVFTLLDLVVEYNRFRAHIALPTVTLLSVFPFAVICARPRRAMGGLLLAKGDKSAQLRTLLLSPAEMGAGAPLHYVLAVVLSAAATLLRHWLTGYVPGGTMFVTYLPAVVIAALVGGLGPGILATILSAASVDYFFLHSAGGFGIDSVGDFVALLLFIADGILISWMASTIQLMREKAAEAVRLHDAELRQAQRLAHLIFWTVDLKTGQVTWSAALYRMLGLDPAIPPPPYTQHCWLFTADSWTRLSAELNRTWRDGTSCEVELETILPNGQHGWMITRGEALFDTAGKVNRLRCIAVDITERKQAEFALRRSEEMLRTLNAELETRVEQRTAELTSAIKELESFTYTVAHDLRAPLRTVSGFSRHVLNEFAPSLPPDLQHYLERIDHGARTMGVLVDELLNLARVNRQDLKMKATPLNDVVSEVIRSLQQDSADRPIDWNVDVLPAVECDPLLIKQVFENLLSNAVKFTRPRSPAVITIGQKEKNGFHIISVRDNGVGFSMLYADKLFGIFQRLHRQDEFEGVGVGLATVQRIIQKHGGRVWAEGEVGKGATFYFSIAAATAASPAVELPATAVTMAGGSV